MDLLYYRISIYVSINILSSSFAEKKTTGQYSVDMIKFWKGSYLKFHYFANPLNGTPKYV